MVVLAGTVGLKLCMSRRSNIIPYTYVAHSYFDVDYLRIAVYRRMIYTLFTYNII